MTTMLPRLKAIGARCSHVVIVALFTLFAAFPFYWMLITTFKRTSDLMKTQNNPFLFNEPPTLEHLRVLFSDTMYARWLWNTGLVGVLVVAITLILAVPAAYSLARLTGRFGEQLGIGIFLTYLVPPTILFIPLSRVIANLGLQDSLWSLVVVYPSFTVPFCTWLLMGFFKAIPRELEEAAMIDGLSRFGAFLKVVIPISIAGILTVVIFTFTDMIVIFVLTRGGPYDTTQVLASLAFFTGILGSDLGEGAAISLFLFPVLVAAAFVFLRIARRAEVA